MRKMLLGLAGSVYTTLILALLLAAGTNRGTPPRESNEADEVPVALARKLAKLATFAPGSASSLLGDDPYGAADQDWLEHATPGNDVSSSELSEARKDWQLFNARPARSSAAWEALGPSNGLSPFNPYRDRGVYNAGTPNFSGRTVAAEIDPNCSADDCRLWIGNANGGVWMTPNALAPEPAWEFVSATFEHNSVAALQLDPNDPSADTLWAGTGEPNACGSGCEAGVGLYLTKNGGKSWKGPIGLEHFVNRGIGSIAVRPGNSDVIFAASGRAGRGISNTCCGGVDQLIPGAPHFGLYRTLDGGQNWELVTQGAAGLCTTSSPDAVALNQTPCSPRGARRVMIDPTDPNTVYVSLFARGIWRSTSNGDTGTWEQIMAPLGPVGSNERAEFDIVRLTGGETRMYVGVGGGAIIVNPGPPPVIGSLVSRFRRNDAVRSAPAPAVLASWTDLTNFTPNTPGYSSRGYCDPQCSYDNYVYVPPGADANTVYLSGSNQYGENDYVFGRSNGRAVLLSTDAGATFTDMTEDDTDQNYPVALHPDHHALVTNPNNWRQFFDLGDGGVARSNGIFINDAGDCVSPKGYTGTRLTFCQLVLSRVPQRIDAINKGLRTLHFYQLEYSKHNPDHISGGTQDNGSWETLDQDTWINTNIADGGHNSYDALGGDADFRLTAWQQGQLEVSYNPQDQVDVNWISDTLFVFYGNEGAPFIANAITDPLVPGWLWTGREHVFRSQNYGRNLVLTRDTHRLHCNVWTGDGDVDGDGTYEPATDLCDDWKPLGDPGANGRLTAASYGPTRAGGHVALVERGKNDRSTLWATTSTGRVFISKNADNLVPSAVTFIRLDTTDPDAPPRYPTALFIDPKDANHAWITFSGYNAKTPATPGHVFEIRYVPGSGTQLGTGQFTRLDGQKNNGYGDIPANSIVVSDTGTIYVGNDFGVVLKEKDSTVWHVAAAGLPNVDVADLVYVPERRVLYAGTHGQGIWKLQVH
jgi:hypothetical protein